MIDDVAKETQLVEEARQEALDWGTNGQSPAEGDSEQIQPDDGLLKRYEQNFTNDTGRDETWMLSDISAILTFFLVNCMLMILLSRTSLQKTEEEISLLFSTRGNSGERVKGIENHVRHLHYSISTLNDKIGQEQQLEVNNSQITVGFDEINLLERKVRNLSDHSENLKAQIQETSRKEVFRSYGSGVHCVEIELIFPDDFGDGPNRFVIELAPLDLMPHSVEYFLHIVSAGLLDGCSFVMNAVHVLKVAPLPYNSTSAAEKIREFAKTELVGVAFREYNEIYPHEQFTVGFVADGNPGFYINMADNVEFHVGDPCFGKIVAGFDAILRLVKMPTTHGIWLKHRVGIKHAKLLETGKNIYIPTS